MGEDSQRREKRTRTEQNAFDSGPFVAETAFIPIFFGSVLHFPFPYAIIEEKIKLHKSIFNQGVTHGYQKAESLGRAAAGHGETE